MKSILRFSSFLIFLMLLVFWNACKHEPVDVEGFEEEDPNDTIAEPIKECSTDTVYFENDILPMLASNCALSGCHGYGSANNDVSLENYNNIISTADVRAGDPEGSDIYEVITETDPDKIMPPPSSGITLNPQQKEIMRIWIEQGAKNNFCNQQPQNCDTSTMSYSADIVPILSNCLGCHSDAVQQGGVNLSTYNQAAAYANNGTLFGAVNHEPGFVPMPQGQPKLPECNILKIRAWIDQGAQNN